MRRERAAQRPLDFSFAAELNFSFAAELDFSFAAELNFSFAAEIAGAAARPFRDARPLLQRPSVTF
ncbi:hypothetical protein [Pseudomonas sp. B21-047]|uniref:hypothetical protein n=1 Tax=Pseudomonas sp. B21-047 TaxID=2895489 RepID=UPI002160898A|nr:hypothetical protein [Pseudomonas sp. B21-047]UVL05578.1 hypothetical protein LOY26_08600 [Pseudomonas sp. B21-047]